MVKKISLFFSLIIIIFCFFIFLNALKKDKNYSPSYVQIKTFKDIYFKNFQDEKEVISQKILNERKYYLINIWSSWCIPCIEENKILLELKMIKNVDIVGINYKDRKNNAKKFLKKYGNPYEILFQDEDGTKSIELGAFGVPETFLVDKELYVIKKFIGPLNYLNVQEIKKLIK